MTLEEISEWLKSVGEPSFRAKQIFVWLHKGVSDFSEMTNLSKSLRQLLNENFVIYNVKIKKRLESSIDNTVKYLYELHDGEFVESVLMKYKHGYSVCISTQVGCRMGCKFCASGLWGLKRNLTASEMLSQVKMAEIDNNVRVSNVVMMGMGEPLDNYDNSIRFLRLISHQDGMNIGLRHISLSTSGLVSGIYKLLEENLPITLSISLHASNNELRSAIMPVNNKWSIEQLLNSCRDYYAKTHRRISFEYALIKGINDSDECAKQLAAKLDGMQAHLNLIPVNPVQEHGSMKTPDRQAVKRFCDKMNSLGVNTTVRRTLGQDINASCGQLRRTEQDKCKN
ncbi:MAG: 23S rRNA (adenine(2503)-C(2))-methyltransferase RlmN [bacterium]|nr:23S rRNA (adenine(2503)-C(2))-methyltransferase RlmN [bacterium]